MGWRRKAGVTMGSVTAIKTEKAEVLEDVREVFETLRERVESRECVGLAYTVIFSDGDSFWSASRTLKRREIVSLIVELLLDVREDSRRVD